MSLAEEAVNNAYKTTVVALFNQLLTAKINNDAAGSSRFETGLTLANQAWDDARAILEKIPSP